MATASMCHVTQLMHDLLSIAVFLAYTFLYTRLAGV